MEPSPSGGQPILPRPFARSWVLCSTRVVGLYFQDQAMSDRTFSEKPDEFWTVNSGWASASLERAEFVGKLKLFGWSRFLSSPISSRFQVIVALWPVAVTRGSFKGFPASLERKRHLHRKATLERPFFSFSWHFPILYGAELANLGGVLVGAFQAQLWRSGIKGLPNNFTPLWLAMQQ